MKLQKLENKIIIVTGLSGAGRTTALKILEDIGFEAVDNLPFFLLHTIVESKVKKNLAIGVDIRSREFDAKKLSNLIIEKKKTLKISILFFDCETNILINRFKETRRTHPLKLDLPISDIINRERVWLQPLKKVSDFHIDTSELTPLLLRKQISGYFNVNSRTKINVRILSFGYKYGIPREADYVFDMRFIENPFYVKSLKKLSGKNEKVKNYVKNQKLFTEFFKLIDDLFDKIISGFKSEGKEYINIAFGCTGGVHRSVVASEHFFKILKKKTPIDVLIDHRDLGK